MIEARGADPLAEIDPEESTDFATVRPQVSLDEDYHCTIVWPTVGVWSVSLLGPRHPRARARSRVRVATFTEQILGIGDVSASRW